MKQKRLAELYIILLCAATILNLYMPKIEANSQDPQVIPNEAIRLRILADSDSAKDQEIKRKVRDAVNAEITSWVEHLVSLEEARNTIREGIPELQKIAEEVVAANGSDQTVKAEFNKVKFPTKLYGQYLYPAGEYEAVLITLGEGTGSNWWCVLFPPLCFLDFSNGEATSQGFENGVAAESPEQKEKASDVEEKVEASGTEDEASVERDPVEEPVEQAVTEVVEETVLAEETSEQVVTEQAEQVVTETVEQASESVETETVEEKSEPVVTEAATKSSNPVVTETAEIEEEPVEEAPVETEEVVAEETTTEQAPVYDDQEEEQVEMRFFVVDLWNKIFG